MLSVGDWSTCNGCGEEVWIGGDLSLFMDHMEDCERARVLRDAGSLEPRPNYVDHTRHQALEASIHKLVREVVYTPFWCRFGLHRWEEWPRGKFILRHCIRCDKWRVV